MKKLILPAALLGLAVACGTPAAQKNVTENLAGNLTVQAAPSNALSRAGWNVQSAPASGSNPAVILDGNEGTVWTSSSNQANGLGGLRIDLGAERQFSKLVLEAGAGSQNFLRSYNIYLSNDANNWGQYLKGGISNSGSRLEVDLGARSGRYLTVQNGYANPGKPWSVAELWLQSGASGFVVKRALNVSTLDSQYLGFPLPDAELSRVTRAGFDTIRLVTDVALTAAEKGKPYIDPDGTFNDYGKQKVDAAVNGALRGGLNVIVDIHTVRSFPGTGTPFNQAILCGDKLGAFEKFLTQIAGHLTKYPRSKVALELMNEPNDNGFPGLAASYGDKLKRMYDAARRGSGDMMLIVSGLANSSPFQLSGLNSFIASNPDQNTIVTVHYYGPLEFSHQGATYIADQKYLNCFENIPYPSKPLNTDQRTALVNRVKARVTSIPSCGGANAAEAAGQALRENYLDYNEGAGYDIGDIDYVAGQVGVWAKERGFPASRIFLGEFGVQGSGTTTLKAAAELEVAGALPADRAAWTRDVRTSFEKYGFSWAYFSYAGGSYSILQDRNYPTVNYAAWDSSITGALGIATP